MNRLVGLAVLCTSLVTPAALCAQEQENPSTPGQIPDPSTYQGSMVLQQQSDQQDQAYRQQYQQQSQGYQQSYGGDAQYAPQYGGGSSQSGGMNPSARCFFMLERAASFAALRGLVELGTATQDPRYFTISRRATAAERPVLLRWAAARRQCLTITSGTNPRFLQASLSLGRATINMIGALARGEMTYGDFAYRRAQNLAAYNRWLRTQ